MTEDAMRNLFWAMESRRNAHHARRTKLPGWKLYFRAEMRRAIAKWRAYANLTRGTR